MSGLPGSSFACRRYRTPIAANSLRTDSSGFVSFDRTRDMTSLRRACVSVSMRSTFALLEPVPKAGVGGPQLNGPASLILRSLFVAGHGVAAAEQAQEGRGQGDSEPANEHQFPRRELQVDGSRKKRRVSFCASVVTRNCAVACSHFAKLSHVARSTARNGPNQWPPPKKTAYRPS